MNGSDVISSLKKKFHVSTDAQLAKHLGITAQSIHSWKNRKRITARQLAGLVGKAYRAGEHNLQAKAIRPLVEFFRLEKSKSSRGVKYNIFGTNKGNNEHPYLEGLKNELERNRGVYVFFDSRGQAIYVGQARRQNLWQEMNNAFNRERGDIQKIRRVNHPTRRQAYRTSDEQARQIRECEVPLHELTAYFSAYLITDGMIDEVEAMLVRSFANNLLNKHMERFDHQKRYSKAPRRKQRGARGQNQ